MKHVKKTHIILCVSLLVFLSIGFAFALNYSIQMQPTIIINTDIHDYLVSVEASSGTDSLSLMPGKAELEKSTNADYYSYNETGLLTNWSFEIINLTYQEADYKNAVGQINSFHYYDRKCEETGNHPPIFCYNNYVYRLAKSGKKYPYAMLFIGTNDASSMVCYIRYSNLESASKELDFPDLLNNLYKTMKTKN